jgi:hypothetical protein
MIGNISDRVAKHVECEGSWWRSVEDKLRGESIVTTDGVIQQASSGITIEERYAVVPVKMSFVPISWSVKSPGVMGTRLIISCLLNDETI